MCLILLPFSTTIDDIELGAAELTEKYIVRLWIAGKTKVALPNDVNGNKLPNDPAGESATSLFECVILFNKEEAKQRPFLCYNDYILTVHMIFCKVFNFQFLLSFCS